MAEIISMRKLKWTRFKKSVQEGAVSKANQAADWVRKNEEALKVAVPMAMTGCAGALRFAKSVSRSHTVKADIKDRQTRFYDHSLGMYWHTKRPLRPDELLSVQKRKAAGESYGDIFKSMKLLK